MTSKDLFATLFLTLYSFTVAAAEPAGTRLETQSSAVLPPLPDLPIPGTHSKVSGNQDIQAVTTRSNEPKAETQSAVNTVEPSVENPSPLVFGNGSTGQIVF